MVVDRFRTDDTTSYSDSVSVTGPGKWVHIAGQLAFDDDRRLIDGDVAAQAHHCFDRIGDLVVGAGGEGLASVVAITVYLLRLEDYSVFEPVRRERFGDSLPASAAVQVSGLLFGGQIEISAVAFIPNGS